MEIQDSKLGKRAIVFSGGGVKGVFAAGVVMALRHCNLDMDVITGSSVGALNATLLAEDTLKRRQAEKLFDGIKTYNSANIIQEQLRLWETLEVPNKEEKIFSSKIFTPIIFEGILLTALTAFLILTESPNPIIYTFKVALSLLSVAVTLWLVNFWFLHQIRLNPFAKKEKDRQRKGLKRLLNGYLKIHGFGVSLFENKNLKNTMVHYIPETRTFKDYKNEGIDLRITRTNIRTGKMEISEYCHEDKKGRIMGNPRVVKAALASGAFPSALPPVKVEELYPKGENPEFWTIMKSRSILREEFKNYWGEDGEKEYKKFMEHLDLWELRQIERFGSTQERLREFEVKEIISSYLLKRPSLRSVPSFSDWLHTHIQELWRYRHYPRVIEGIYEDTYFDGGTVDNTPISTAFKGIRELVAKDPTLKNKEHLILVILLSTPRKDFFDQERMKAFNSYDYGLRGLYLLDKSKLINDIKNAAKLNQFTNNNEEEIIKANLVTIFPEENLPWVLAFDEKLGYDQTKQKTYLAAGCRSGFSALSEAALRKVIPSNVERRLHSFGRYEGGKWRCRITDCPYYEECQLVRNDD